MRAIKKTPGDFVMSFHDAVRTQEIGRGHLVKLCTSRRQATTQLAYFRQFLDCLRNFPLHLTSVLLKDREWRGGVEELPNGLFAAVVKEQYPVRGAIDRALTRAKVEK